MRFFVYWSVAFLILSVTGLRAENSLDSTVEIYQEHEGNLRADRPSDARGNFFDFYEPTVDDPVAMESAIARESWWTRQLIYFRQKLQPSRPVFELVPISAKIHFLETVEQKLPKEKAWDGSTSLLLKKRPAAFSWLSEHPSMEAMPSQGVHEPSFWFPEVKTDRNQPARSVKEALERTKSLIEATGLEGLHFHVFHRASPEELRKQTDGLVNSLLVYNERVFLEEAERSSATALYSRLQPWENAHSARATEILNSQGNKAHPHNFEEDSADPKGTYVALRYWGIENGKQVVSVELRAGSADLKVISRPSTTRGLEEGVLPVKQRDYSTLGQRLTELTQWGPRELLGFPKKDRVLNLTRAEQLLSERLGSQKALSLAQFSDSILGLKTVPAGLLMAFEHPEEPPTHRFIVEFGELAKLASSPSVRDKNGAYLANRFSEIFRVWARDTRLQRFTPSPTISPIKNCPADLLVK